MGGCSGDGEDAGVRCRLGIEVQDVLMSEMWGEGRWSGGGGTELWWKREPGRWASGRAPLGLRLSIPLFLTSGSHTQETDCGLSTC